MILVDEKDIRLVVINVLAFIATWVKVPLLFIFTSLTTIDIRSEVEAWLRIVLLVATVLYTLKKLFTKNQSDEK